ncbi:MAG: hypothetical protein JOZ81_20925 [Chloroflexi bacterium]|nr:hypothetical protein [Chloroflexota bacterium]
MRLVVEIALDDLHAGRPFPTLEALAVRLGYSSRRGLQAAFRRDGIRLSDLRSAAVRADLVGKLAHPTSTVSAA